MKLSEFLDQLDILGARPGKEYVGTKLDNPAMVLEEKVAEFARVTDLEDIQESLKIFQEKVCIQGFPERYSPQFWLAHTALSAIYKIMCGHLQSHFDLDLQLTTNRLLFELWAELISAGPGSTHLEMMDIILKNQTCPLWKYMESLQGERLHQLILTLRTDFVYEENVSAEHYATLMETHIDKIFRSILSLSQMEECRRELLDLYLFYLSRMNHVPPHIGPRLSHLCFLISNRFPCENPYVGVDDWVLTRTHLRVIKEVITHQSFTVGSEAQYRAPITLEKIFEAAVLDKMLEILLKDFLSLLLQLCNYGNCRKCKRLFVTYQSGLFEQLDFKKEFKKPPDWLFDQCIAALTQIANLNTLEKHMDEFIISTEDTCLLHFQQLSVGQVAKWHKLLVNHLVSGRACLVREVGRLLDSPVLQQAQVFNWKTHVDSGRMLVDIISDVPWTFMQDDENSSLTSTVEQYSLFLQQLLTQLRDQEVTGRYTDSINRCVLKCLDQAKAAISLVCLKSDICDFKDGNFIREVLFTVDTLFKDLDVSCSSPHLTEAVHIILTSCLTYFREKGYIAVDFNSLMMSISIACARAADPTITEDAQAIDSTDLAGGIYTHIVREFINLHTEKGSLGSISSLVPQLVQAVQECVLQSCGWGRCVQLLGELGTGNIKLLTDHTLSLLELLLDYGCLDIQVVLLKMYHADVLGFVGSFQTIYDKLLEFEVGDRHVVMELLAAMSLNQAQLFTYSHITELLIMYPEEMPETQQHILDIVGNLANKGPSLVTASHHSMLLDTTQFSPLSLRQRGPILVQMSSQSEDLKQRTMEHLMQYVGHKDDAVCLVAMETLVPLLRDTPGYVQKHKTRFRNLWKTSGSIEVKELCARLLPDIKYSGRKPESKAPPSNTAKVTPMPAKTKAVISKPVLKSRETSTVSAKPTLVSPRTTPASKVSASPNPAQPAQMSKDSGDTRQSIDDSQKEGVLEKQSNPITVHSMGDSDEKKEYKLLNDKPSCEHDEEDRKTVNAKEAPPVSVSAMSDVSITDMKESDKRLAVPAKSNVASKSDFPEKGLVTDSNRKPSELDEAAQADISDANAKVAEVLARTSPDHVDSSSVVKAPVCLRVTGTYNTDCLMNTLRDTGYDSYVEDTRGQLGPEHVADLLRGAKVLIYCIVDTATSAVQIILSEIEQFKGHNMPVIILRMKKFPALDRESPLKRLKEQGSIRFYLKPGEQPFKGGNWPQPKFCELLMQMNYHGILQDQQLVKTEMTNLLNPSKPVTTEKQRHTDHVAVTTAMPEVFISYHWGKQSQVEPLYHYLSGLGVRCWMSVYHMFGSESLYNRTVHGVHCCRVMLPCLTSNYTHSTNCQQEVAMAHKLNKPILPLLLGETKWPLEGDLGATLAKHEPICISLTSKKAVDTSAAAMRKLLQRLAKYVQTDNLDTQARETTRQVSNKRETREITPVADEGDSSIQEKKINEESNKNKNKYSTERDIAKMILPDLRVKDQNKDKEAVSGRYAKRSASMIEMKKAPSQFGGRLRSSSSVVEEMGLPQGVAVDDMGYTMRSARSKSCHIL